MIDPSGSDVPPSRKPSHSYLDWRSYVPIKAIRNPPPVVAVVNLHGVIGAASALRRGLSLSTLAPVIERAFSMKHLSAVALMVNSPGGSPVQSHLIFKRIRDLSEEREIPVYTFVEDAAASGGYWLALAGDEIFVDESSIVGSIGVVSAGFGFTNLIKKIGIERRVHTAGTRKAMFDPFRTENRSDIDHLKHIQSDIHDSFIQAVRDRRGARLGGADEDLFSGAFWTGRGALERGLADGIGEIRQVMRERFGEKVRFRAVEARRSWRARLGLGSAVPDDWTESLISTIEEKAVWTRLGL